MVCVGDLTQNREEILLGELKPYPDWGLPFEWTAYITRPTDKEAADRRDIRMKRALN